MDDKYYKLVLKIKKQHDDNLIKMADKFNKNRIAEASEFYKKKGKDNVHTI